MSAGIDRNISPLVGVTIGDFAGIGPEAIAMYHDQGYARSELNGNRNDDGNGNSRRKNKEGAQLKRRSAPSGVRIWTTSFR